MFNREDLIKYYDQCFPKVKSLVKDITGEYYKNGDEEDIFQDALIVFYENCINNKLILTTDPCGYIYGVARNKTNELRRKRDREIEFTSLPPSSETLEKAEDIEALIECVNKLPEEKRKIIIARYYGKFSMKDIAEKFGFSTDVSVRMQIHRLIKTLGDCIKLKNK